MRYELNKAVRDRIVEGTNQILVTKFAAECAADAVADIVDSPIERIFLSAWMSLMSIRERWREPRYGAPVHVEMVEENPTESLAELMRLRFDHPGFFAWPAYRHVCGDHTFHFLEQNLIFTQVQIGQYRADFALVRMFQGPEVADDYLDGPLIVECDGAAFHDATADQLRRDRRRDRVFARDGYTTMRFTGSELFKDPVGCAVEVDEWFTSRQEEREIAAREAREQARKLRVVEV